MTLVSEYHVTREYGGPEEGGWWYDWYDFARVVGVLPTEDDAIDCARACNDAERAAREGPDRYSMVGGADVSYVAEDAPGAEQSHERPRYE